MAHEDIPFAGDKVALVVRGKESPEHVPGKRAQHADCVRSQGAPVGYFGEDGEGNVYITTAVLIGVRGEVYDLGTFTRKRPYYVDASIARAYQLISTALVVRVTSATPVQAPSLGFLIEVDWGQGRLVREYSALVSAPESAAAVAEPVIEAPAMQSDRIVREPGPAPVAAASTEKPVMG